MLKSIDFGKCSSACVYLANLCFRQERYAEAENWSREALKLDPDSDEANFHLGCSLHELGRLDEAKESFWSATT